MTEHRPSTQDQGNDSAQVLPVVAPSDELPADGRDVRGRFTLGNTAALVHGGRSQRVAAGLLPEQAEARALMREREQAIVRDLGGDLSQVKADMVTRYLETALIADFLADNIARHGALTGKGRTRAAVTAYLQVLDRQHRLALLLGLERRQKRAVSLADVLAQHEDD